MYIVKANCDYCGNCCSREPDDLDKYPMLHTPGVPFVRNKVCAICWDNIKQQMDNVFSEIASGKHYISVQKS